MEITDIRIRKTFEEGPMKAVVSVTFDNELAVHDIKVINAHDRYFIVMPGRKNPDGSFRDIAHPINGAFRHMIEVAVLKEYESIHPLETAEAAEKPAETAEEPAAEEAEI
ncbi:MAG: septation regulator SpoVG [Clostridia bacterium]|nr:septation regulator SpoVG [Clostridia bacterium]